MGSLKTVFFSPEPPPDIIYGNIYGIALISGTDVNAFHMKFTVKAKTERNFQLFLGASLSAL